MFLVNAKDGPSVSEDLGECIRFFAETSAQRNVPMYLTLTRADAAGFGEIPELLRALAAELSRRGLNVPERRLLWSSARRAQVSCQFFDVVASRAEVPERLRKEWDEITLRGDLLKPVEGSTLPPSSSLVSAIQRNQQLYCESNVAQVSAIVFGHAYYYGAATVAQKVFRVCLEIIEKMTTLAVQRCENDMLELNEIELKRSELVVTAESKRIALADLQSKALPEVMRRLDVAYEQLASRISTYDCLAGTNEVEQKFVTKVLGTIGAVEVASFDTPQAGSAYFHNSIAEPLSQSLEAFALRESLVNGFQEMLRKETERFMRDINVVLEGNLSRHEISPPLVVGESRPVFFLKPEEGSLLQQILYTYILEGNSEHGHWRITRDAIVNAVRLGIRSHVQTTAQGMLLAARAQMRLALGVAFDSVGRMVADFDGSIAQRPTGDRNSLLRSQCALISALLRCKRMCHDALGTIDVGVLRDENVVRRHVKLRQEVEVQAHFWLVPTLWPSTTLRSPRGTAPGVPSGRRCVTFVCTTLACAVACARTLERLRCRIARGAPQGCTVMYSDLFDVLCGTSFGAVVALAASLGCMDTLSSEDWDGDIAALLGARSWGDATVPVTISLFDRSSNLRRTFSTASPTDGTEGVHDSPGLTPAVLALAATRSVVAASAARSISTDDSPVGGCVDATFTVANDDFAAAVTAGAEVLLSMATDRFVSPDWALTSTCWPVAEKVLTRIYAQLPAALTDDLSGPSGASILALAPEASDEVVEALALRVEHWKPAPAFERALRRLERQTTLEGMESVVDRGKLDIANIALQNELVARANELLPRLAKEAIDRALSTMTELDDDSEAVTDLGFQLRVVEAVDRIGLNVEAADFKRCLAEKPTAYVAIVCPRGAVAEARAVLDVFLEPRSSAWLEQALRSVRELTVTLRVESVADRASPRLRIDPTLIREVSVLLAKAVDEKCNTSAYRVGAAHALLSGAPSTTEGSLVHHGSDTETLWAINEAICFLLAADGLHSLSVPVEAVVEIPPSDNLLADRRPSMKVCFEVVPLLRGAFADPTWRAQTASLRRAACVLFAFPRSPSSQETVRTELHYVIRTLWNRECVTVVVGIDQAAVLDQLQLECRAMLLNFVGAKTCVRFATRFRHILDDPDSANDPILREWLAWVKKDAGAIPAKGDYGGWLEVLRTNELQLRSSRAKDLMDVINTQLRLANVLRLRLTASMSTFHAALEMQARRVIARTTGACDSVDDLVGRGLEPEAASAKATRVVFNVERRTPLALAEELWIQAFRCRGHYFPEEKCVPICANPRTGFGEDLWFYGLPNWKTQRRRRDELKEDAALVRQSLKFRGRDAKALLTPIIEPSVSVALDESQGLLQRVNEAVHKFAKPDALDLDSLVKYGVACAVLADCLHCELPQLWPKRRGEEWWGANGVLAAACFMLSTDFERKTLSRVNRRLRSESKSSRLLNLLRKAPLSDTYFRWDVDGALPAVSLGPEPFLCVLCSSVAELRKHVSESYNVRENPAPLPIFATGFGALFAVAMQQRIRKQDLLAAIDRVPAGDPQGVVEEVLRLCQQSSRRYHSPTVYLSTLDVINRRLDISVAFGTLIESWFVSAMQCCLGNDDVMEPIVSAAFCTPHPALPAVLAKHGSLADDATFTIRAYCIGDACSSAESAFGRMNRWICTKGGDIVGERRWPELKDLVANRVQTPRVR